MAVVIPFRGLLLNEKGGCPISQFLAPPYDVVSTEERDRIVSNSRYNIFSLELPPGPDGPQEAANTLQQWIEKGILRFDATPAIYPYEIEFQVHGRRHRRRGMVAAIRVEPWESRTIRPHELTFSRVTDERLALIEATKTQFSQIFLLYKNNPVPGQIMDSSDWELLWEVEDGLGNTHRLGRINSKETVLELCCSFKDTVMYIADGHHRYTTALEYSRRQAAIHGTAPEMPFLYQMAYIVDAEDPGLVVLPTHRIIALQDDLREPDLRSRAHALFEIEGVEGYGALAARSIEERLNTAQHKRGVGVIYGSTGRGEVWWLRPEAEKMHLTQRLNPVLALLDVTMFDELVMAQVVGMETQAAEQEGRIQFHPEAEEAAAALSPGELLFVLRPTPTQQVLDVADAGLTMPHKSTFFYPKILTGMVLRSVDPALKEALPNC